MKTSDSADKRLINDDMVWNKIDEHTGNIGELKARMINVEREYASVRHDFINHRALVDGDVKEIDHKLERIMTSIETKLENFLNPLLQRVGRIEIFMYSVVGGGGAVLGLLFYFDKIKAILRN